MKNTSKSKSKPKKPAAKKSPAPKARPATPPKRTPAAKAKPAAPKPAKAPVARKPRGKVTAEVAPTAPPVAASKPPRKKSKPAPAPAVQADFSDALEIPGEAIDGRRFALAITYAARVTPKDMDVVFTSDPKGRPLVSGHDQRRCHTAYFSDKAAFHLRSRVPREAAMKLAKALLGLSGPLVRLGAGGEVLVRHGLGQPPMRLLLGKRPITQGWEPPSQEGRSPAVGTLKVPAAWQSAACKWAHATVHSWQSADGIEWFELQDEDTGELLARAVVAEVGRDLYAEDDRQGELPGSRTAGKAASPAAGARTVREEPAAATPAPEVAPGASDDEEPFIEVDGKPVEEAPAAVPEETVTDEAAPPVVDVAPVPDDTRVWIPEAKWDELSPDGHSTIVALFGDNELGGRVGWITGVAPGGALRSLESLAGRLGLPLHLGDDPPAGSEVAV